MFTIFCLYLLGRCVWWVVATDIALLLITVIGQMQFPVATIKKNEDDSWTIFRR